MKLSGILKTVFGKFMRDGSADKACEVSPMADFERECSDLLKRGDDFLDDIEGLAVIFEKGSVVSRGERRQTQQHTEQELIKLNQSFRRLCDTASNVLVVSEHRGIRQSEQDRQSDANKMLQGINQVIELMDRISTNAYNKGCTEDLIDTVDLYSTQKHDIIEKLEDLALKDAGNVFIPEKSDPNKFGIDH